METISTWHIRIKGQVQGVGFRPFVYQLANKYKLKGHVNNGDDGLHIVINASEIICQLFYDEVLLTKPHLAHISSHSVEKRSFEQHRHFDIINSSQSENRDLLISPDFAMCALCAAEINEKQNRRYNYAFTTCTQCGPRYSIINELPYDRHNTAMAAFNMCNRCSDEYNDPLNRRYYSQTNSCPDCPILITLYDQNQKIIEEDQKNIVATICKGWSDGKIIAIKGIGGYLLTCDASNTNAITELRLRKKRPSKPLALMFPDLNSIKIVAHVNATEENELTSAAAPIVLLQFKEKDGASLRRDAVAPKLSKIGTMLPYTPLFKLSLQQYEKPVIATSGNKSKEPIVYEDSIAVTKLNTIADYIVSNNREIIAPQDDSVVAFTKFSKQRIMLRRARGFAPSFVLKADSPAESILACGALMKSCFTILHNKNIHVSPFLGNADNYDVQKKFSLSIDYFLELFKIRPEVILIDKHPGYFTSLIGMALSNKYNARLIKIQHHEAHFASVLGEHNLLEEAQPILGVIWDGTGFGDDFHIWGGEFFIYQDHQFQRTDHFSYFNHFLGDKIATEPRLSAFSFCHDNDNAYTILQTKFTMYEWKNYQKLISTTTLKTSSVGRMFDAVASLLGLLDNSTFEGEAAMLLEEAAQCFFCDDFNVPSDWLQVTSDDVLSSQGLLFEIVQKINAGTGKKEIAAWFHVRLVMSVKEIASRHRTKKICFSGGVFQNGLLVDLLIKILGDEYQLYFNKDLAANDENISFGQLQCFEINKRHKD